jgi:hypothetical protein
MVSSLILLAVMSVLVFTMRAEGGRIGGRPGSAKRPAAGGGDRMVFGPGIKVTEKKILPDGKVSYRLMREHKLPSPAQRFWRRLHRFVGAGRRVQTGASGQGEQKSGSQDSGAQKSGAPAGRPPQSAELQDFLEARRREIQRRNASDTKRGPDDTLH